MFAQVTENLAFFIQSLNTFIEGAIPNIGLNAAAGDMISYFENSRVAFDKNVEIFLMYGLILLVAFFIGIGVYSLTHSKDKKKKQS